MEWDEFIWLACTLVGIWATWDFFGIRQSGVLDFKLADIYQDADVLAQANKAAAKFESKDIIKLCKKYNRLKEKIVPYAGSVLL